MHVYVKYQSKNYILTEIRNQGESHTDDIMSHLVSAPNLACANFSLPFIFEVDASLGGLGAVLSSEQEGNVRPLAYAATVYTQLSTIAPWNWSSLTRNGQSSLRSAASGINQALLAEDGPRYQELVSTVWAQYLSKEHTVRSCMGYLLAAVPNHIDLTFLEPAQDEWELVMVMTDVFSKSRQGVPTQDQIVYCGRSTGKRVGLLIWCPSASPLRLTKICTGPIICNSWCLSTKAHLISWWVSLHICSCLVSNLTYLSISCWANSLRWCQGRCVSGSGVGNPRL